MVRGEDLYVANAGDSRCVFSRKGRAVAMTTDHKPTDPLEHARITKVCNPLQLPSCIGKCVFPGEQSH